MEGDSGNQPISGHAGDAHTMLSCHIGVQQSVQKTVGLSLFTTISNTGRTNPHHLKGLSEAAVKKARGYIDVKLTNCLSIKELFVLLGCRSGLFIIQKVSACDS
jgi:hypothetical protein